MRGGRGCTRRGNGRRPVHGGAVPADSAGRELAPRNRRAGGRDLRRERVPAGRPPPGLRQPQPLGERRTRDGRLRVQPARPRLAHPPSGIRRGGGRCSPRDGRARRRTEATRDSRGPLRHRRERPLGANRPRPRRAAHARRPARRGFRQTARTGSATTVVAAENGWAYTSPGIAAFLTDADLLPRMAGCVTDASTSWLDRIVGAGWAATGDAAAAFDPLSSQGIVTGLGMGHEAGRVAAGTVSRRTTRPSTRHCWRSTSPCSRRTTGWSGAGPTRRSGPVVSGAARTGRPCPRAGRARPRGRRAAAPVCRPRWLTRTRPNERRPEPAASANSRCRSQTDTGPSSTAGSP